jgi:saccharopine dehydrogenase-like NADP-dependent oxidoreductase
MILKNGGNSKANIVISMLPAHLHIEARIVLSTRKNLVTASYVSKAMQELDGALRKTILFFMNENGIG